GELCDWYLELVKPRLRTGGDQQLAATLIYLLSETLALAHPMIPFVTEEIWSYVPGADGLLAARVGSTPAPVDELAEEQLSRTIDAVQAVRGWRTDAGVAPGAALDARLAAEGYSETSELVALLGRLSWSANGGDPAATIAVPGGVIEVLSSDKVDLDAAQRKRAQQRERLEAEIERAVKKLGNDGFVAKAPPHVVQAERDKLERLRAELEGL
ncbi:MAG TPA: class I tRNA ligase family protein, partial [Solirubrobacteraceae bacterium]|nr:class I tRNA ligase family protein [Solirubrobacteraceae bacterium]